MSSVLMSEARLHQYRPRLQLVRSPFDRRDYKLLVVKQKAAMMPASMDLSANCPPVFDQGSIGSCTANSSGTMFSFIVKSDFRQTFIPSRLYIYYNTRLLMGNGAYLRTTMQSLVKYGTCGEASWPYNKALLYARPSDPCYKEGDRRQALNYAAVATNLAAMKAVLQSHPFVIGIVVCESFLTAQVATTGMVPVPKAKERVLGGHAVCVIGYNDAKQCFLVRNSWGRGWGLNGNFYLPYKYATTKTLAFDAWVIYDVENPVVNAVVVKPPARR
jgi:C1A family cysteine protease